MMNEMFWSFGKVLFHELFFSVNFSDLHVFWLYAEPYALYFRIIVRFFETKDANGFGSNTMRRSVADDIA